jgi:hypothetical protein
VTMSNPLTNWKTSASGILSFITATGAVLTALPTGTIPQRWAAGVTIASGLAKAYIGLISKDAGVVEAIPAGQSKPQAMASTEVPIDPTATVVTKETK